jgi:putative transposase
MPRTARIAPGGIIYHVLNRGVGRSKLFRTRKDFLAFQTCLVQTLQLCPVPLLAYCVMPNHWHLLLWPAEDGDLAQFMMRLTNTHVRRWLTAHQQVGTGHLYQGRYKSFACQNDEHLLTVGRYIERNPVRADLVTRAQDWPWSSLGQTSLDADHQIPLGKWPIAKGVDWPEWVNRPQTAAEEDAIRRSVNQQAPFGSETWIRRTMKSIGWTPAKRPGRPKKST